MIPPICVQTHICIHSNQSKLKHQEVDSIHVGVGNQFDQFWGHLNGEKLLCVSSKWFSFFPIVHLHKPDLFLLTRKTFGEGTAWQEALSRRKEAYTPAKRREKRFTPSMKMTRGMLVVTMLGNESVYSFIFIFYLLIIFPESQWKVPGCMGQSFTCWTRARPRSTTKSY